LLSTKNQRRQRTTTGTGKRGPRRLPQCPPIILTKIRQKSRVTINNCSTIKWNDLRRDRLEWQDARCTRHADGNQFSSSGD